LTRASTAARCSRRRVLAGGLGVATLGALGAAGVSAQSRRAGAAEGVLPPLPEFLRLVAANRILANESVVDAFGHISVRDPRNPEHFVLSRSRSPALVELADLMEFAADGTPVDARGRTAYGERMIHAAVYEARPEVMSVIHHHAYGVLPFTITNEPLRPVIHTASLIGAEVPVWDERTKFGATDMLVRTLEQGRDLAATLGKHTCALMRGHGAVVVGTSIQAVVLTAVYMLVNAEVLSNALKLGTPNALSPEEIERSSATQLSPLALDRAWEYFCQRAGVEPV
jgi:HCOMODA/2-hydroxy-3-carboxy-muconic semialdehyde decarboxylase